MERLTKEAKMSTDVLKSRVASAPLTAPEATLQESIPSNLETAGLTKDLLEFVECQRQYISTVSQEQVQGLPMKEYLEVTLLPVLLEGMKAVVRERPRNPSEYLAVYLLKNGPKNI